MKYLIPFIVFLSSITSAQKISDLLPDSSDNWTKSSPSEIYAGKDLFKLIDGGAEIFLEYGFNQVITQRYTSLNDNSIDIEIYEMKDSSSSFGIFSLFTFNTGKKVDFSGDAYTGDQFLIFRKGNYYVSLTELNPIDTLKKGLFTLARKIDSLIMPAGKPEIIEMLENKTDLKIVYLKGRLALYNLITFDPGNDLIIQDGAYFETNTGKNIILKYKTPQDSRDNYASGFEYLKSSGKYNIVSSAPDNNILSAKGNFIDYFFTGNYILITLSDSPEKLSLSAEKLFRFLE